ncbi:hypothetical protein Tco_1430332 [Tanacetum coccineum]
MSNRHQELTSPEQTAPALASPEQTATGKDLSNPVAYPGIFYRKAGFHQIIDFINRSHICYALTKKPESTKLEASDKVGKQARPSRGKASMRFSIAWQEERILASEVSSTSSTTAEAGTQEERKEAVNEPAAKRKKSIPRKTTRKRQKLEVDTEKEELKTFLDIVPREEAPIDIESLSTKFPIVDWKTIVLTETFMYYQVFRGDGSSKNYKILSEMLEDFDRMDVEELFRLVKERYSTKAPEGFDLMLWGDLHTLFEPDKDDEIWRDQHEYNLLSWRLCDFCGIHILLMDNGLAIHMLTEKKYPLSQEMLSKMLSRKLEVDHESSQAFELLRFIRAQVQK